MTLPTRAELSVWADEEDLLDALGRIDRSQQQELLGPVEALASHAESDIRQEALRVLFVLWKVRDLHSLAVDVLLHDSDPEVRAAASYGLASISSRQTRNEDVRLLLRMLEDEEQPEFVRRTVYDGLLILFHRPAFPTMQREFLPMVDVDWSWIESIKCEIRSP